MTRCATSRPEYFDSIFPTVCGRGQRMEPRQSFAAVPRGPSHAGRADRRVRRRALRVRAAPMTAASWPTPGTSPPWAQSRPRRCSRRPGGTRRNRRRPNRARPKCATRPAGGARRTPSSAARLGVRAAGATTRAAGSSQKPRSRQTRFAAHSSITSIVAGALGAIPPAPWLPAEPGGTRRQPAGGQIARGRDCPPPCAVRRGTRLPALRARRRHRRQPNRARLGLDRGRHRRHAPCAAARAPLAPRAGHRGPPQAGREDDRRARRHAAARGRRT